jgi:amino acid transporter
MLMLDMNSVFYVLTIVSAQIYLVMYTLMFISAIVLRITRPDVERSFRVPGGRWGIWVVAGGGAMTCVAGIVLMLVPPQMESVHFSSTWFTPIVGGVLVVLLAVPLALYQWRNPAWKASADPDITTKSSDSTWERGD